MKTILNLNKTLNKSLAISAALGLIGSIFNLMIVASLSHFQKGINQYGYLTCGLLFIALVAGYVLFDTASLYKSSYFSNRWMAHLRNHLHCSILATPWSYFHMKGQQYFHTLLDDDLQKIESFVRQCPSFLTSTLKVVLLLSYMLFMFPKESLIFFIMISIVFGIIIYIHSISERYHKQTRHAREKTTQDVIDSIQGFRELKVDPKRSQYFMNVNIKKGTDSLYQKQSYSNLWDHKANSAFLLGLYFIIGTIMLSTMMTTSQDKLSFIIIVIMVISPLSMVIMSIPLYSAAKVAYANIGKFLTYNFSQKQTIPLKITNSITLQGIKYRYPIKNNEEQFTLLLNYAHFSLASINFIVGGNGCGKSSLINLLTGLITPQQGSIFVDGTKIDDKTTPSFQASLSVIYQNPYLFKDNISLDIESKKDIINDYLIAFHLNKKVSIENNNFTGLNQLSFGQRKRLNLIISIIEDKDVYIFDEWAADQDPYFRQFFYSSILPSLRDKGKLIIAITHDKEYFTIADKILTMHNGTGTLEETDENIKQHKL